MKKAGNACRSAGNSLHFSLPYFGTDRLGRSQLGGVSNGSTKEKTLEFPFRSSAIPRSPEGPDYDDLPQVQHDVADARGLPDLWFLHGPCRHAAAGRCRVVRARRRLSSHSPARPKAEMDQGPRGCLAFLQAPLLRISGLTGIIELRGKIAPKRCGSLAVILSLDGKWIRFDV